MRMDRDPIDRAPMDREYSYGNVGTIILYELLMCTDTTLKTITKWIVDCVLCIDTITASDKIRILIEKLYTVDWQFNKHPTHALLLEHVYTIDTGSTFGHLYTQILTELVLCIDTIVASKSIYVVPVVVLNEFAQCVYTTFNEFGTYFTGMHDIDGRRVFPLPTHITVLNETLISVDSVVAYEYDQPVFMKEPVRSALYVWERTKNHITNIIGGLL